VGSRGFLTFTNLIIMYSISHGLGKEKLGIYSISAFIYYLFSFLTSFELTTYFGKEVAHQRDRLEKLKRLVGEAATTFIIGLTVSVVLLMFMLVLYKKIDVPIMLISTVSGIVFGIEKNLTGFLLGKEKMQFEFISQILAFAMVAAPVFLVVKQLDILGVYILRISASIITILFRKYYADIKWYVAKKYFGLAEYNWKEISFFSASGFSYFIQHHLDLFVLSFLITKEEQGGYYIALRVFLAFCLLAEMTSFALTPYISRIYRRKESGSFGNFRDFYKKMLFASLLFGAAAAVLLFFTRDYLVAIFAEENIQITSGYLYYFSFLIFFRFVSYYTGNVLTATRYQNIRFYILISSAVLLIGLEFTLGTFFSVEGIICARAVVELFIFVCYLVAIAKIRHKPIESDIIDTSEWPVSAE
jgi:O-antigen/teichoic acid export membrane protein